jgi:hypothetical protein
VSVKCYYCVFLPQLLRMKIAYAVLDCHVSCLDLQHFPRYLIKGAIFGKKLLNMLVGIAQSIERLATGWTVRGSNPGGGEIFRTTPDRHWGPRSRPYNGYQISFPGVKRPGRHVDNPPILRRG